MFSTRMSTVSPCCPVMFITRAVSLSNRPRKTCSHRHTRLITSMNIKKNAKLPSKTLNFHNTALHEQACLELTCDIFPIYDLEIWLAGQQKFIVKAYPIDGHICTVMNPIQWRDKWRGLWEVPGQCGPIQHVSIVLNTIDMTGCRHNSLEVLHVSRGFTVATTLVSPLLLPSERHHTCFISSNVRGCWDLTGPRGERVFNRLLTLPTYKSFSIINIKQTTFVLLDVPKYFLK